ncbi:MAG: N-acetylneuraminate epimerase [Pasteurellaceae bacterium]|nr:N-acetylneuraminate epimerase [Pasteurellaceae bacterium]
MKTKLTLSSIALLTLSISSLNVQASPYPDLPVGIKSGTGTLIDNTAYVGLGTANDKFYSLNLQDPNAQWKEIAAFPGGKRDQAISASVDGKLYVFGGLQKNEKGELQLVNDAYCYNPADNNWTKIMTRSPRGIVGASAAVHQNKIYVFGGVNEAIFNGYFQDYTAAGENKDKQKEIANAYFDQRPQDYFFNADLLSYEPATNKWYHESYFPFSGRAGAVFAIKDNNIIVANGEIKPGLRTAATEKGLLNTKGVKWTEMGDLPAPKGQSQDGLAGAFSGYSHGNFLITGGANFPGSVKQFNDGQLYAHNGLKKAWHKEVYVLTNNKWKIIGELPLNVGYGVSLTYQDKVLLIGGETDGGKALTSVQTMSYDGKQLIIE